MFSCTRLFCGSYVHQRCVDVIGTLAIDGDQEGEAAVWREDVHAAVLLVVPRQQGDAAVFHPQRGGHHVESLSRWQRDRMPKERHLVVDGANAVITNSVL